MSLSTNNILDVLSDYGIDPYQDRKSFDLPSVGSLEEGETVYAASLSDISELNDTPFDLPLASDDVRVRQWWSLIEEIIKANTAIKEGGRQPTHNPPEPLCAWYCPIHFFGHGWGIYIRESCILSHSLSVASFVNWSRVHLSANEIARQLLRASFYSFFLHEQFHHKVESLGFRFLIATGSDRYRPYKSNVYRPNFLTPNCLEESLANADSFLRLDEKRYKDRLHADLHRGLQSFLRSSFALQPPGYYEGLNYLSKNLFSSGQSLLQSQVLEATLSPVKPSAHWSLAPNVITSLKDISSNIYVVLPVGAKPIFPVSSFDPAATVSTSGVISALTKHYGYSRVKGGKGSHVKLKRPRAPTITLPGDRPVLSPHIVKQVLDALGGHSYSQIVDMLDGKLKTAIVT